MYRVTLIALALMLSGVWATAEERAPRKQVRETVVPRVEYRDEGVDRVFEHLSNRSRELDPEGSGINIIYRGPDGDAAPRITLSLRRVSLYDAIRYITQVAGLHYRIDDNAVFISDEPFRPDRIITRFYPVQPTFMDIIRSDQNEEPRRDPFLP